LAKSELQKHIPNVLSLARVLCAPCFVCALAYGAFGISLVVLLIGALSDFFDGFLARKFDTETKTGALLDPLADKVFANFVLWGLYVYGKCPYPTLFLAVLLTIRDTALLIGGFFILYKKLKLDMSPIFASKLCTAMIFVFCFLSLCYQEGSIAVDYIGWLCIVCVVVTFALYIRRFKE
jgi:cardiolipin synthase